MGRARRIAHGDLIYHVINRANARRVIFTRDPDYRAFERAMVHAQDRFEMRILAYCLMPNHWHLVLWPRRDGDLSSFMRLLTLTHAQRWHAHQQSAGTGHLYQGRFKSFVVDTDSYLLAVCRYVERNALRARLVERAEEWPWSSLWRLQSRGSKDRPSLSDWPVPRPRDWLALVNGEESDAELHALRQCVKRGTPYGNPRWTTEIAKRLGLESTLRSRGRPRLPPEKGS
jgi:putative transposase